MRCDRPYRERVEKKEKGMSNKQEYEQKLAYMPTDELFKETKMKIWLSAFANNNSKAPAHWQVDLCYDEWRKRGDLDSYSRAHAEVVSEATA